MRNVRQRTQVSVDSEYEYLSAQLRYLDDKIFRTFALFFTIATTITGGTFYLYLHPNQKDLTVDHFGFVGSGMLIAIGLGSVLVVSNNLRSWREHRKEIRKLNPNAPPLRSPQWWLNEILGCVGITLFVGVYLRFNPLYHIPSCCGIAVSFLTFIVGILPLLLCDDSRTE